MADWEIDENGDLVKVGKVDNGINPTTDLPWGVYPDKGSPTGYTHTASGTPVYKDGSAWSGTTSDRAINVNVAAPVTWGPSQTDDDGHVTGVPGAVYQVNSRGDVSILSKPKAASQTATNFNDTNGDGYDDQTGLPNGAAYVGGKLYYHGIEINPDGSPKTATAGGKAEILIDRTGSVTGRAGTSYYYDSNGVPHTLVTGSASSSSSSGGGSSSGGSSSGGSSAGGGLTSPANRTNTTIHEGGFNDFRTTTNISEIGPVEAALRAAEFAATNSLSQRKQQQDEASNYAKLLETYDPAAVAAFLRQGGGDLQNAIGTGWDALSQQALTPAAMALAGRQGGLGNGLGMTTGGGGLQLEGGGPTSPGGGLPSAPAATPATPAAPVGASSGISAVPQVAGTGGSTIRLPTTAPRMNVDRYGSSYVTGGTQTIDPSQPQYVDPGLVWHPETQTMTSTAAPRPGYMTSAEMSALANGAPVVDPRIAAQATDIRERDNRPNAGLIDLAPAFAGGGLTRAPQMIVGDPQMDGMPNPEMIINPTNAPISVMPMRDMMPMRAMGGLPRYAYGSYDSFEDFLNYDIQQQQAAVYNPPRGSITPIYQDGAQPNYQQQPAPQPVAQPAPAPVAAPAQPAATPAPVASQPASQPAPQPAQTTTTTQPTTTTYGGLTTGGTTQTVQPAMPSYVSQAPAVQPTETYQPPASLIDQVKADRMAAQLPEWAQGNENAFMLSDYELRDPIERQLYESYLQMRKGVPVASTQNAWQRNRQGGLSRASVGIGY